MIKVIPVTEIGQDFAITHACTFESKFSIDHLQLTIDEIGVTYYKALILKTKHKLISLMSLLSGVETINFHVLLKNLRVIERSRNDK